MGPSIHILHLNLPHSRNTSYVWYLLSILLAKLLLPPALLPLTGHIRKSKPLDISDLSIQSLGTSVRPISAPNLPDLPDLQSHPR